MSSIKSARMLQNGSLQIVTVNGVVITTSKVMKSVSGTDGTLYITMNNEYFVPTRAGQKTMDQTQAVRTPVLTARMVGEGLVQGFFVGAPKNVVNIVKWGYRVAKGAYQGARAATK